MEFYYSTSHVSGRHSTTSRPWSENSKYLLIPQILKKKLMIMNIRKNLRWQDHLSNMKILIAHHRQEGKVGTPTREFGKTGNQLD